MNKRVVFHVDEVMPFFPEGEEENYCSKLLIDRISVGSENLILNEFTVMPGKRTYKGAHVPGYDEVYFLLEGNGYLYLEDMDTHEYEAFKVRPGSYAFILGGRGHYLINTSDQKMVAVNVYAKKSSGRFWGQYRL